VYKDTCGLPTIGWGHRLTQLTSFADGVTPELAEHILACDVNDAEDAVHRLVKVPLTQGQFDALVDFVFNLGSTRLCNSTLLKDLNAGHYDDAAEQLLCWDHGKEEGKEVELADLKARRKEEVALWKGGATV
jgi:lysozyme